MHVLMAVLAQCTLSVEDHLSRSDSMSNAPQILGSEESGQVRHGHDRQFQHTSDDAHEVSPKVNMKANMETNETQQRSCCSEGHDELAAARGEENEECGIEPLILTQGGSDAGDISSGNSCQRVPLRDGVPDDFDGCSPKAYAVVDVDACSHRMDKLSIFEREEGLWGDLQRSSVSKGIHDRLPDDQDSNLSRDPKDQRKGKSSTGRATHKSAGWITPVFKEPEFVMEASSWPTLAEACNLKTSQTRSSSAQAELKGAPILPSLEVPSSQEQSVETSEQAYTFTTTPGLKYRQPYRKWSYGKPRFPAAEHQPVAPQGFYVPSTTRLTPSQSVKGDGFMEINNFYSGPPQVPHYNYVHYPRAGVFYSFYYNHDNSTTPFAIGNEHPVRLHCSQDYGYVNFTHTGCVHPHDPSVTQPVSSMVSPSLQMNTIDYNHPSFQGLSPCGVHYEAPYNDSTMLPSEAMTYMHALSLQKRVQNQIEYYFSDENLCKDKFLISKMDDEGYVPVSLIASFPKIKEKTSNTTLVLESMKNSTLVEVKNDKLRRYNWEWVKTMLLGLSKIQLDVSGNWSERGNGKSKASFKEGQFDSGSSLLEGRMVENSLLKQIQAKLSV